MKINKTGPTNTEGTDRAWIVGVSAGCGAVGMGILIALPALSSASSRANIIGLVATIAAAIGIGLLAGTVWSRIEDAIERRDQVVSAIRVELNAVHRADTRNAAALERLAALVADGALSWGAGPALGTMRVRVEYEDQAYDQLGETTRRRQARMRLVQSGLDLLADKIRTGSTLVSGMRLEAGTVEVLDLSDDTVLIALRASAGTYLAVHGRPRADWHAFAVTEVAPLTLEQARQHGIALA